MKKSGFNHFLFFYLILLFSCGPDKKEDSKNHLIIDASLVRYTMEGGIGASWHAMSLTEIDEDSSYTWALREKNNRGSAWGGNPPVTDTSQWSQICNYAKWLGLNWVRVEISASMYEPGRNIFDWDNEEMQALYLILDCCEKMGADVFLQQMWSNVKWNSYPGVQPLLSAPKSVDDFAFGIGELVEHLTRIEGYHCIKWVAVTNEPPGGSWGSWWSMGEKKAPLAPTLKAVNAELKRRNLEVAVSGPDWTDLPVFDPAKIDFDDYIGSYDIHSYQGIDDEKQKILEDWANWAIQHHKPLFLSEIGDMKLGWGDDDPGPRSFMAALSNAESILRGLQVGVHAFNRWSFTNRGDLDGQWQLIRTWDLDKKKYFNLVEPEPVAFYGYGIITRFMAKHSKVLETRLDSKTLISQSLLSPGGKLSCYLLNRSDKSDSIDISITIPDKSNLYLFRVTEEEINTAEFEMKALEEITDAASIRLDLPPRSISVLTQFHLEPHENGIIKD